MSGPNTLCRGVIAAGILLTVFQAWAAEEAASQRWYTATQVELGARIYTRHCAGCHGPQAAATPEWRRPDADGHYPPPPLNGTAHTWHHPLPVLRKTIREGGARLGGRMPAFDKILGEAELDAVIAWFQSLWRDEIYEAWEQRNHEAGRIRVIRPHVDDEDPDSPVLTRLQRSLPGTLIGPPTPTPVPGIRQVKVGGDYAYVSEDGRYVFIGELLDLVAGKNLTAQSMSRDRLTMLAGVPDSDVVSFPARGEERARITVFTDTTCAFCRRLHGEVPALQAAGVTVRYLAFPRGGLQGPGVQEMRAVWCAGDRRGAMDIAKGVRTGELDDEDCAAAQAVERGYRLGQAAGVQGTPAIVLANGTLLSGYRPASKLLAVLGLTPGGREQASR